MDHKARYNVALTDKVGNESIFRLIVDLLRGTHLLDIALLKPEEGTLQGVVTHLIFKGVHYEMEVTTPDGFEWLVHSTDMFPVGQQVGLHVDPFDIQIMNKPASEDEEALGVNE